MKIFLSAVSSQFKACRDALASDLRAIGCTVVVQEDFQQGPRTLIEWLEERVAESDRVIALVGNAYGFEAVGDVIPIVDPLRSYTQWEWFFAQGLRLNGTRAARKDIYLYLASDTFLKDHPIAQSVEFAERQRRFIEHIKKSGEHRNPFNSLDHLCRLVLRDGWKMNDRPRRPRCLPYDTLGPLFKGRDQRLTELHDRLLRSPTGATAITTRQAIHGLGGVGKTRLAVEYALLHAAEYTALLFVIADSPESLRRNLATLCGPQVLNLSEHHAREEEVKYHAVLRWLGAHPGWLLMLDNVDTPTIAGEVEALLAQLPGGHVLITSRLANWSGGIESIELDVLDLDDAKDFLLARTEGRRQTTLTDAEDARALAEELGGLALALEQAGAFISVKRDSLGHYLQRWKAREATVRNWYDPRLMKYPRSVAVTWDTTVDQLDAPALALLRMLCWLASEPVPRSLLEIKAAQPALTEGTQQIISSNERAQSASGSPVQMEEALATLAGFSLLKWEPGNAAFRMHRLVAEVARERLPKEQQQAPLQAMLSVVNAYLPADPPPNDVRSWPRWDPLRAHVHIVIEAACVAGIAEPTSRLMNELALVLKTKCIWKEAEQLYRRVLAIDESNYGVHHPKMAISLGNLAQLLQATNRLTEAELLMRRSLAIDEKCFGAGHPNIAIRLNNLASLLQDKNRMLESEPMIRQALAIDEKHYGDNHPLVAVRLSNLAQLLHATNRLSEAEPMMRRALAIGEKNYGNHHPTVATFLNNLSSLLQATKRRRDAEPLIRRALAIDERSYGGNHPKVATRLNNLAELLRTTKRATEAEPLLRRARLILIRCLGLEHPNSKIASENYADLLRQLGSTDNEIRSKLEEL